jgi:hypothetical protein
MPDPRTTACGLSPSAVRGYIGPIIRVGAASGGCVDPAVGAVASSAPAEGASGIWPGGAAAAWDADAPAPEPDPVKLST